MKRMIFLLGLFAAFLFSTEIAAQDELNVGANATNFTFALDAGDTVSATGTVSKVIDVRAKKSVQLYSIMVTADSISGTPTATIVLAGSMDNSTYTTITSVSWAGSSSDTTFHYTDISTGVAWAYLRVRATASAGKGQLTTLIGRMFDEVR